MGSLHGGTFLAALANSFFNSHQLGSLVATCGKVGNIMVEWVRATVPTSSSAAYESGHKYKSIQRRALRNRMFPEVIMTNKILTLAFIFLNED